MAREGWWLGASDKGEKHNDRARRRRRHGIRFPGFSARFNFLGYCGKICRNGEQPEEGESLRERTKRERNARPLGSFDGCFTQEER